MNASSLSMKEFDEILRDSQRNWLAKTKTTKGNHKDIGKHSPLRTKELWTKQYRISQGILLPSTSSQPSFSLDFAFDSNFRILFRFSILKKIPAYDLLQLKINKVLLFIWISDSKFLLKVQLVCSLNLISLAAVASKYFMIDNRQMFKYFIKVRAEIYRKIIKRRKYSFN